MISHAACPFCAIASGEDAEVELLFTEANWLAFFPLEPATPGHTLVIPRVHVEDLWQASPDLASDLMTATLKVGHALQEALQPEGMNLIASAGKAAEQTVLHLHLHVVPRWRRDGFGQIWPRKEERFEEAALSDFADRIRAAFENDTEDRHD